jgi:hypothetical protein
LSGVIKNETATSLAIVSGNGVSETVLRSKIKKLRALNLSLMPEGLEQAVNPQQMADLIAYLREGGGDVLRDAPSVARFILDGTKSQSARETAVHANPQFTSALVTEMTRDLTPGTPEEYLRIPWIWRVAIDGARRNDAGQIRGLLDASLPKSKEPLRDWQAVVLGGGVINGLSERGLDPAQRVKEIIGSDAGLLERWQRAIDLSSEMADNEKIAKGTRYDALRMLGVESWQKRGAQLARYLGKNIDAELQMGAVSGLLDLHSHDADETLAKALPDLTEHNRGIALNALISRPAAAMILKMIEDGTLPKSALRPEHLEKLVQHESAAIRKQAQALQGTRAN